MPPSTLYAALLALVIGVGCGKGTKEEKAKICYWCKESIKVDAIICKWCSKKPNQPTIEEKVESADNAPATPKVEVKKPEPPKVIPNRPETAAAIEAAVRKAAEKPTGELTKADLEKVTELRLKGYQISDVSALKGLTQLTGLILENNQISDVSALKELKQLKWLNLSENQLTDVSALQELTQLTGLWLPNNQISDVSALKELKQFN